MSDPIGRANGLAYPPPRRHTRVVLVRSRADEVREALRVVETVFGPLGLEVIDA